jgi:hypothetical protein
MSPLIGGNPVKTQMGLYADLNGQTLASLGRLGSTTALETDRMMDQLQGKFYRRADFGRYVGSVADPLRRAFGDSGFERLNGDWSMNTIRGLEGVGATRVNRDMGSLLESSLGRIQRVRDNTDMKDDAKSAEIAKIREEAKAAADSFLSSVSSTEAQQKMGKGFADALQSDNAKTALKEFKDAWKGDIQDAFRMAERGVEFKSGKVPGAIDYRFTRGFNIEDLTGAFGRAASAGLVGTNTGLNLAGFSSSSVGALDAARGLFGRDLSGRELTEEINKLIGIGSVNMADEGDARKLEEMLRNVKAMARVAGVSIESMKTIIGEAKGLAAQNPNLPIGMGGFTAAQIATQAMGDTTAALSYMDPKLVRALGGPVGVTSGRVAALTQGAGEPTSRILGALHYHATQVGGPDSAAAKAIRDYAQNGDTTAIGLNTFLKRISPSLNMSEYQALSFAQTNPLLSNLGLEQAPEIGRAGVNAMKKTMLREWDRYTGGTVGFGEELLKAGLDPRYHSMSDEQIIADVQSRLARPLTNQQKSQLLSVVHRSKQKKDNGEGLMNISDVVATAHMPDRRGTAQKLSMLSYDVEFARQYNPQARSAHRRIEETRKTSARLEAFHAASLAEVNAPILQRLVQSGIDGSLAAGDFAELRRLFSGGTAATSYMAGVKNLADADALYRALPEAKFDEAGKLIGGGSEADLQKILKTLYPSIDLDGLGKAEKVMGRKDLGRVGALFNASRQISTTLQSGGITTYGELEDYLGRQHNVPSAIAELAALKKSPANKKLSAEELKQIAARISGSVDKTDIGAIVGKYSGKGIGLDVLRRAGQDYGVFDPEGQYSGDFKLRNMVQFGITSTRFAARTLAGREQGNRLLSEMEAFSGEDDDASFKALQRIYKGEIDFSEAGVGKYTSRLNIDTIMGIADADPNEAVGLAKSALSQAGLNPADHAKLLAAAKQLRSFDSEKVLKGSKRVTHEDLYRAARASKISKARSEFLAPYYQEAGENAWDQMLMDPEVSGTMHARLSKIKATLMGGRGDLSVLSEGFKKSPEMRRQLEALLSEDGSADGNNGGRNQALFDRYLGQFEEAKKGLDSSQADGRPVNPLAMLDIKGIITAISNLTSAVTSASKNP